MDKANRSATAPFLLVLGFVVGSASLGAEIAAARLLAPFFGASTIVWAAIASSPPAGCALRIAACRRRCVTSQAGWRRA